MEENYALMGDIGWYIIGEFQNEVFKPSDNLEGNEIQPKRKWGKGRVECPTGEELFEGRRR